ncbi:MAG: hypothetical protein ACTSPB_19455 [Candidatus Thorarchaeota archaeon]
MAWKYNPFTGMIDFYDSTAHIGGEEDYASFNQDGQLLLHGKARVKRHIIADPKRFKIPATNYPGESYEGLFYTLDFDKNTEESAYLVEHIPYRWDSSTDMEVMVSWFHDSADSGAVVWGLEYISIKAGETVAGSGTAITQASGGNHDPNIEIRTVFTEKLLHSNLDPDDDIAIRFFRKSGDSSDTLNEDARMVNVHIVYIENILGKVI